MKSIVIFLLTFVFALSTSAEEKNQDPVIEIATSYFKAITEGDLETAEKLVSVPFSFLKPDIVLMTIDEIKDQHRQILQHIGRRELPKYEVSKTSQHEVRLNKDIFKGDYDVVSFLLLEGDNSGDYVYFHIEKLDGKYSVVGISEDNKYQ